MRTVNAWLALLALAASQAVAQSPATGGATPATPTSAATPTAPQTPAIPATPASPTSPATGAPTAGAPPPGTPTTAATEAEFRVPPGWRQRGSKGDDPIYCRNETVTGTRFEKERCLTRSQLRQAEALNRDYGKDILKGTNMCLGENVWCSSGK